MDEDASAPDGEETPASSAAKDPIGAVLETIEEGSFGLRRWRRIFLPRQSQDLPLLPSAEHTALVALAALIGLYAGLAATLLRTTVHLTVTAVISPGRLLALLNPDSVERARAAQAIAHDVRLVELSVLGALALVAFGALGGYRHFYGLTRGRTSRAFVVGGLLSAAAFAHIALQVLETLYVAVTPPGENLVDLLGSVPVWALLAVPILGGVVLGLYNRWTSDDYTEVPDVIAHVARAGTRMPGTAGLHFAGGAALTSGALGSAGLEGPVVVFGATTSLGIGQRLALSRGQLRLLAAAGAAAGISASFNAPIAGALFALEIIVGDFALTSFSPVVIASVVGVVVHRSIEGNMPALPEIFFELRTGWELFLYVGLGLFAGVVGTVFVHVLEGGIARTKRVLAPMPMVLRPVLAIGGLVIVAWATGLFGMLGSGYAALDKILHGDLALGMVAALLIGKMLATTITLGSGGAGGIMFPSLMVGAATGSLFGGVAERVLGDAIAPPVAYAVVGMGAVLTAVQQAPLTATVMIFEFTNDYSIVMPLLVACILSTLLATRALGANLYTRDLMARGIRLMRGRDQSVLAQVRVKDAMQTQVICVHETDHLGALARLVTRTDQTTFPVLDDQERLKGVISLHDIRPYLFEEQLHDLVVAAEIETKEVTTVSPEDSLAHALEAFSFRNFDHLVVVQPEHCDCVVGMLSRQAIVDAYRAGLERDAAGVLGQEAFVADAAAARGVD